MRILGINAYHGDSAACLVVDGRLVAAVEEERFRRVKHWAGFPAESVRFCLEAGGVSIGEVDHVAVNRNPNANLLKKALFAFTKRPSLGAVRERLRNSQKVRDIRAALAGSLGADPSAIRADFHAVEHHRAHLASAFFVSPFEQAAVVSVDGFGDFVSAMWASGEKNRLAVKDQILFPHSLGLFYLAITQFLGFPKYGDEYKMMGLSAYGRPTEVDKMRRLVRLRPQGRFELNLDFFLHHSEGVSMVWESGEPVIGSAYSEKLVELLGKPRGPADPVLSHHQNIAASAQAVYEEAFFHFLNHVHLKTRQDRLALAGGCAMNSVANGKIYQNTKFKQLFIQPAAGDAGGAIGAAFYLWNETLGNPRGFVMDHAYWGAAFGDRDLEAFVENRRRDFENQDCTISKIDDPDKLVEITASRIADGKVVGWFQGRMEWGPRALGNRSILCDPTRPDMKDILNRKIKRRESFRPFAPSILREAVSEWFETDDDVPFMLQVYPIRAQKRGRIPAVTHVNGSGRLQTVTRAQNLLYYVLIEAFGKKTGVPMLLNTSFNENEPIVCRPAEAADCFLRTKMDVLVLGPYFIERR